MSGQSNRRRRAGRTLHASLALLVASGVADALQAQTPAVKTTECSVQAELMLPPLSGGDIARVAELAGRARLRPRLIETPWDDLRLDLCGAVTAPANAPLARMVQPIDTGRGLLIRTLPVILLADDNSAYPRDRDNGAVWAGRGLSTGLSAGVGVRWGVFSAALDPEFVYQQNRPFELATQRNPRYSQYAYPFELLDWPQRFGPGAYSHFYPGQSYARIDAYGVALGFSTENLRWGPALRNPLLLSYTAPGIPHVFIGTSHPWNLGIGRGEARAVFGRLTESPYFDFDPTNNHRTFTGMIADFEPRWLPGLFLGASEVFEIAEPAGGASVKDYLRALINNPVSSAGGNRSGNGLASLFLRWAMPASGFEVYTEWGRDDYAWTFEDLLKEPDHSQVYTLGLQKVVTTEHHWVRILAELTHLESSQTLRSGRGVVTFYTHGGDGGHTQEGQLLGAPIGPGSDSQYLGTDVFSRWGSLGAYVERVRFDDNAYYNIFARMYGFHGHDVELTFGVRPTVYWHRLAVTGDVTFSHRYDRNFLGLDGANWDLRTDNNVGARLSFSWWPALRGRPVAVHLLPRGEQP